mmetsp:Transcript_1240/g.5085  ORF Transcript_1240/g.5085 Transcript_1240/m.5085 type:complete len:212 (-) Transcript_1240:64-699(-)
MIHLANPSSSCVRACVHSSVDPLALFVVASHPAPPLPSRSEARRVALGRCRLLKRPLVLPPHLLLLLRGKVVPDVERLANLLRSLALDHVRHGHARQVQEGLDVQVVGSQDELEEGGLVDLDELRVEVLILLRFALLLLRVVLAVVDHLLQDLGGNVGERDGRLESGVLDHVLDCLRLEGNLLGHLELLGLRGDEGDEFVAHRECVLCVYL